MIIAQYYLQDYGFHLAEAAIEIEELTCRKDPSFQDPNDLVFPYKDGYVRINVWVNQEAYNTGKKPIYTEEKPILLDYTQRQALFDSVLQGIVGI